MLPFQASSPGYELKNGRFILFLFWNKNKAVYEGMASFSAVLDRMGQFVAWAYSTFIDTYPGPGFFSIHSVTEMNKAQPLPMRNSSSARDVRANREVQLRYSEPRVWGL